MVEQRSSEKKPRRVGFILAGGRSRRMGGADKAAVVLEGRRLVEWVFSRLSGQLDCVLICGHEDYGCGLQVVRDRTDGPKGPAAGVFAAQCWMRAHAPDDAGFFTAPVDGPFLPGDLVARLAAAGGPAIAADTESDHPTFAYWTLDALARVWRDLEEEASLSLRKLAAACEAKRVVWDDPYAFYNINSLEDLKTAVAILRARPPPG